MKRITVAVWVIFSMSTCLCAQPIALQGFTDVQRMNLKGPVSQVVEVECNFHEAFGEIVFDKKQTSRVSIFDKRGRFLFDTYYPDLYGYDGRNRFTFFSYNEEGKVLKKEMFYKDTKRPYADYPLVFADYWEERYREKQENSFPWEYEMLYEYNTDGKVRSISTFREGKLCAKDIYKYTDNQFEILHYNSDGRRDEHVKYICYLDEHAVISGSIGNYYVYVYDKDWRLLGSEFGVRANNGQLNVGTEYTYNEHGDIATVGDDMKGIKAIDGLEALSKYVHENINAKSGKYYLYEYDSHGNWISKKKYRVEDKEPVIVSWYERVISYYDNGDDGEKIFSDFTEKIHGIFNGRREAERIAREEKERKEAEERRLEEERREAERIAREEKKKEEALRELVRKDIEYCEKLGTTFRGRYDLSFTMPTKDEMFETFYALEKQGGGKPVFEYITSFVISYYQKVLPEIDGRNGAALYSDKCIGNIMTIAKGWKYHDLYESLCEAVISNNKWIEKRYGKYPPVEGWELYVTQRVHTTVEDRILKLLLN